MVFAVAGALAGAAPAAAAPDLTVSATHAKPTFLRSAPPNTTPYSGTITLVVRNAGADATDGTAVTVTHPLPAGFTALTNNPALGAGPLAASGPGWTCTAALSCSRSDALAAGGSYPPITVTVNVTNAAPAVVNTAPTVVGGGDGSLFTGADAIPVAADGCPNGWLASAINPERADGCSLLDAVWEGEPFASQSAFEARVRAVAPDFPGANTDAVIAATPNPVGGMDNSCATRIAFTFDDGPSFYRPQTLAVFRAKGAPATFFNLAARHVANPALHAFTLAEGHKIALHSYEHPRLTNLSANGLRFQLEGAAALMQPGLLPVLRAPFGGTNAFVNETAASFGFAGDGSGSVGTLDFDPAFSATQIRDAILAGLRPGRGIVLHDGPIDTGAGAATVAAVAMLIDEARARGYCFGVLDASGRVVAGRYTNSGAPIPPITNSVPYIPLAYPGTPPSPWHTVPQPLRVDAAHSPAVFARGGTGTLTLTVSNPTTDTPSDDNPTVVTQAIPAGLSATSASGTGWTCTVGATVSCTRMTVLAPGASLPPIVIAVNVAADAPAVIATTPRVTGRGGNVWVHNGSDRISTATPVPGEVGGTVPATLALSVGAASFPAFLPGVARDYTASSSATVTSTAGNAALSVSDPGHLANGAFTLPQPLRVELGKTAWSGPTSSEAVPITYRQAIGDRDALRTGTYTKTLTFTLSTTEP
ncbi:polysaccharide deacetylase family protein [Solirubrobacter phytolaccae]|uniref:Polysaccharide deacetylase family protein n=1 Tax=Solirubrobacter phytolaccae TaxID=1404360 RepID=A0A9X3S8A9_9ACTN|nr:polysaccharide deacetylase family protein [Solirubrobacter phytolaccae]MDA0181954.1 polysaccharide deacetylase family protein [Solirubrobacter phytolaccae]